MTKLRVAIEGPIGVGKTTVVEYLQRAMKANVVFERFDTEKLKKLYDGTITDVGAVELEQEFLFQRLEMLSQDFSGLQICDFSIEKCLIFARKTLSEQDYDRFEKIYYENVEDCHLPDITFIIEDSLENIMFKINKRNRPGEENIEESYIQYLIDSYKELAEQVLSVVVKSKWIDAEYINDFVEKISSLK